MKNFAIKTILFFFCVVLYADVAKEQIKELSVRTGYAMAKDLKEYTQWYDLDAVIQGIQAYKNNENFSEFSSKESSERFWKIEYMLFNRQAQENLEKSENYLQTKKEEKGVQECCQGKLLVEVLKKGNGKACSDRPLMHLLLKILDGETLCDTRESEPKRYDLKSCIDGLAQGVERMCEGERRRLYIHPDMAYGKLGGITPNVVLIAEVELVDV